LALPQETWSLWSQGEEEVVGEEVVVVVVVVVQKQVY
jgi:hypothetical protein